MSSIMTTREQGKEMLLNALVAAVDQPLVKLGFTRKRGSVVYARTLRTCEQQINFVTEYFPRYQSGANAHIHPMMLLRLPNVAEKALMLVQGRAELLASSDIIVNQPIEFTAPKEHHQRWFAKGPEDFVTACASIQAFIATWVKPLLDEIGGPEDLVRAYEENDARVMKQKHWYVFVIAAYELLGEHDAALRLAKEQFGSQGLKKRYAELFSSLGLPVEEHP